MFDLVGAIVFIIFALIHIAQLTFWKIVGIIILGLFLGPIISRIFSFILFLVLLIIGVFANIINTISDKKDK